LPVVNAFAHLQAINLTDHFINGAEAQFSHDLAQLLYNKFEEIHYVIGITGKALTQFWVLRGHTHGAGIQMTFTHHYATFYNKGCSGQPPLFSTQQGGNSNVPAGFHLTIGLYGYAAA